MTIMEYYNNPAGVGAAVIPNREAIRADYTNRFDKLYRTKKDLFRIDVFKDGDEYFILVVIPSEDGDRNNTYDVVVKFVPTDMSKSHPTVRAYNIQLFSNSPSFVYTYAYVFDKEELMVKELRNKFSDETFQPPTTRNPYEGISYEKSTFMAIEFILSNPYLLEKTFLNKARSASRLNTLVRTPDKVKVEIGKEKTRLKELEAQSRVTTAKEEKRRMSSMTKKNESTRTNGMKSTLRSPAGSNKRIAPTKAKGKVRAIKSNRGR